MFERVQQAIAALRDAVGTLDPAVVRGADAARLVELFAEAERLAVAGRTLAARRVDETKLWQREGHRTAAQWIAAKTGAPLGAAIATLETARRLDELPATRDAFRAGRLSEAQTKEIASAAVADPGAEAMLLAAARTQTVARLREQCRKVRAAAAPDEIGAYEAIRRSRYLRSWSDADGAVRLDARLTPDDGAAVMAAIDVRREQIFAEARRAGRRERYDAYAADALVALARGADAPRGSSGPRAMVHVVVDHAALRRGRARAGERCEIPGVGPIPVATARALGNDAIVKAVLTDGADVARVAHLGRTIPARLRTALETRDPVCVVPGCDARNGLEIDHWRIPYARGGPTRLDNLARVCRWHHYQKTHLGYRLSGGPGAWAWTGPEFGDEPQDEARPPPDG